jgi:signal transduction histidine kinase
LSLDKKSFNLNELVNKIITDFKFTVETHEIIKDGEINELVYGDESRIEQVLTNLITNASKYSPKAKKIRLTLLTDKRNAIVQVQDYGFGIAKNDQARIFERYYRTSDKEKNSVSGFGLGLYISSEIIKRHHGTIKVESTIGKGSTFIFTIPLNGEDRGDAVL